MKKLFLRSLVVALAGVVLMAGKVMATPVNFDVAGAPESYVNLTSVTTWGWTDISLKLNSQLDDTIFTLDDGESSTFDFFTATVNGTGFGTATITASLAFDAPDITANGSGAGTWVTFWGTLSAESITWDDSTIPDYFVYNNQLISVDFNDVMEFGIGKSAVVTATVTNLGAAPVPEPATMFLFGTGLAGLASVVRRKKVK